MKRRSALTFHRDLCSWNTGRENAHVGGKKAGSAVRPRIFMAGINDGDKAASIVGGEDVLFLFLPSNRWRSRSLGTKC